MPVQSSLLVNLPKIRHQYVQALQSCLARLFGPESFAFQFATKKYKNRPRWPKRFRVGTVPDFLTFRHYKDGRSPAKRTCRLYPRRNPWYSLSEAESTSGHMVLSRLPRKNSPVTPPGIDPGTSRLVAQCLNHYATPGPTKKYRLNYTSAIFPLVCRLENWFPTYLER